MKKRHVRNGPMVSIGWVSHDVDSLVVGQNVVARVYQGDHQLLVLPLDLETMQGISSISLSAKTVFVKESKAGKKARKK